MLLIKDNMYKIRYPEKDHLVGDLEYLIKNGYISKYTKFKLIHFEGMFNSCRIKDLELNRIWSVDPNVLGPIEGKKRNLPSWF